eukprot:scaffold2808_cov255-Pinguiococcus_pyrenoidosus.AAC.43
MALAPRTLLARSTQIMSQIPLRGASNGAATAVQTLGALELQCASGHATSPWSRTAAAGAR